MGSPSLPTSSTTPSPFHGEGGSWKRSVLFGVVGVVVVGGAVSALTRTSSGESPLSLSEGVAPSYGFSDDLYGASETTVEDFEVVASAQAGYSTFMDYYYGYSIDFPEGWSLDPSYDFTSFSSDYESYDDYLIENFNIGIEDLSAYPSMTLEEYGVSAKANLAEDPYYTYVSEGSQAMGLYEGLYFEGLYEIGSGEQAGVKSYVTVQNAQAYVLTYMYELPEKEQYASIMAEVLASFELFDVDGVWEESEDAAESEQAGEDFGFASLLHLSLKNL